MPHYDYRCETCGHQFEVFQSINDPKLEECPLESCGGRIKRLLGTGAGVIFKGSGFYQTDYRSKSYQDAARKEGGAGERGSSGDKKESTKPDSASSVKPTEAKPQTKASE